MASDPFLALEGAVRELAQRGEPRRYRKGLLLIQEGDVGETLYIVLAGRVKAFSIDHRDREIIYGIYGAGEYLGEMSLDGGPRSASVMTLEPTTCVVITRHTLHQFIAAHPEFAFELLARVIRRARIATRTARSMALLDVYSRMVQLFNELAVVQADGTRLIAPRLNHAEIAGRIGCGREMVSRSIKDLVVGGYVEDLSSGWVLKRPLPGPLPARW